MLRNIHTNIVVDNGSALGPVSRVVDLNVRPLVWDLKEKKKEGDWESHQRRKKLKGNPLYNALLVLKLVFPFIKLALLLSELVLRLCKSIGMTKSFFFRKMPPKEWREREKKRKGNTLPSQCTRWIQGGENSRREAAAGSSRQQEKMGNQISFPTLKKKKNQMKRNEKKW